MLFVMQTRQTPTNSYIYDFSYGNSYIIFILLYVPIYVCIEKWRKKK